MEKASRLTAPEIAFIAVLAVVAIFQVMLCITALAFIGPKGDAAGIMLLRGMMAIGVPPLFVATGIAAVLLVAGDLAEQLRGLVARDALTGALNRRGLEEAAAMIIANARRHGRSEEHTSELQSLMRISYAVFCLKKKK